MSKTKSVLTCLDSGMTLEEIAAGAEISLAGRQAFADLSDEELDRAVSFVEGPAEPDEDEDLEETPELGEEIAQASRPAKTSVRSSARV